MNRDANLAALNMKRHSVTITVGDTPIVLETGYATKQAAGAVWVHHGETIVQSTVCDSEPRVGLDFFPLTVDYREKIYAAGRVPGNFFRREARMSDHETLISRLTDRPIRPLFPNGYKRDTNCQNWVLSFDAAHEPDILSMIGVSAAIHISQIPFNGPLGAVRIGRINDAFVINPTCAQRDVSTLDLVVSGTRDAIMMVECGGDEIPEALLVEALSLAHDQIRIIVAGIEQLRALCGKPKMAHVEPTVSPWIKTILDAHTADIEAALLTRNKHERGAKVKACKETICKALAGDDEAKLAEVKAAFGDAKDVVFRELILQGKRVDGRATTTVRPIVIDLDVLPRVHGSAMFTRGETQGLLVTTLGTADDEQLVDGLKAKYNESFLLHYNFPGFSVGEVEKRGGPGRREIGHGALARRALVPVLPPREQFPYMIRLVSEILESNGSSSMATVCGGSLSMMAAGVPLKRPVAGIAMGLVKEGERYAVLTDILGDEDHYGDMDFKVCGTDRGVTALQMDIKIGGISAQIMSQALEQARQGRLHILEHMNAALAAPRTQISKYAPQIVQIQIDPELIGKIIGKGGETIRKIQEDTHCKLDIDDDGIITIASPDGSAIEKAKGWIRDLTTMPEAGKIYTGCTVKAIKDFGAFVEFMPGTEGLVHISEWDWKRIDHLDAVAKMGDKVDVKLVEVDQRTGKFRLSRKALITPPAGMSEAAGGGEPMRDARPPRDGGFRGGDRRH